MMSHEEAALVDTCLGDVFGVLFASWGGGGGGRRHFIQIGIMSFFLAVA